MMRASCLVVLGLSAALLSSPAHAGSAKAGPAYKADGVVDFFVKSGLGKARSICIGTAAECPQPDAPKFDLLVNFDFNSDHLTDAAKQNLDQFAKALSDPRLATQRFEIDGHTDATGSENYNVGLSERRANAVVAYLGQQGLDTSKLTPKGFGKSQPRVPDPFDPVNRRVETHIVGQ